jgi:hypothetical protein
MSEPKPTFDYDIDFCGWIVHVSAESDAKAKYAGYKVFTSDEIFRNLSFRDYILDARVSGKVRKIA